MKAWGSDNDSLEEKGEDFQTVTNEMSMRSHVARRLNMPLWGGIL